MGAYFTSPKNHGRAVGIIWGIVVLLPFFMPIPTLSEGRLHLLWSWDVFGSAEALAQSSGLSVADNALNFLRLLFIFHLLGGPICIAVSQIPKRGARFVLMAAAGGVPAAALSWSAWGVFENLKSLALQALGMARLSERADIPFELDNFLKLGDYYFNPLFLAPVCLTLILLWGWYRDNRNPIRFLLLALSSAGVALVYFLPMKHPKSFSLLITENMGGPYGWINALHFAAIGVAALSMLTILKAALSWGRNRRGGGRLLAAVGLLLLLILPITIPATLINIGIEQYMDEVPELSNVDFSLQGGVVLIIAVSAVFLPLFWFGVMSRWVPFVFIFGSALNGLLSFRVGAHVTSAE
jgi:hypothetical protein